MNMTTMRVALIETAAGLLSMYHTSQHDHFMSFVCIVVGFLAFANIVADMATGNVSWRLF
jgi:hypothetical protein